MNTKKRNTLVIFLAGLSLFASTIACTIKVDTEAQNTTIWDEEMQEAFACDDDCKATTPGDAIGLTEILTGND